MALLTVSFLPFFIRVLRNGAMAKWNYYLIYQSSTVRDIRLTPWCSRGPRLSSGALCSVCSCLIYLSLEFIFQLLSEKRSWNGGPVDWLQIGERDRTIGWVNETNRVLEGSRTAVQWTQTCRKEWTESWRRRVRITEHDGSAQTIGNVTIKPTSSCTVLWKYSERRTVHGAPK
jgi:hypothetical protein